MNNNSCLPQRSRDQFEDRSLVFQDVVGVYNQNRFLFCARRLGALQPSLRQLDEDVILEEEICVGDRINEHVCT